MPGRNGPEAIANFLAPIQEAASVLGRCKVTCSRGYMAARPGGDEYTWSLCDGDGVQVRSRPKTPKGSLRFYASMSWRLIEDEREGFGPLRVTATRYDYSLTVDDQELWAHHWHPSGLSPITSPHVHIGMPVLVSGSHLTPKAHLPTGRMTFENALRWVVEWGGAPACDDWQDRLALAEAPHLLFRSWTQDRPTETTKPS